MNTEVIGITHKELIDMMLPAGIHCSVDRFRSLAIALQSAALAQFVAVDGKEREVDLTFNTENTHEL